MREQNADTRLPAGKAHLLVPERYIARAELAAIMGVSLATVDRMVAEGMPSVTWGRRTRRFRPSAAISWASERRRAA
jgi:phage terminase Nu1 subunit (DNA packaging protein)